MSWPINNEDLLQLHPEVRAVLDDELAKGNKIVQTWSGWPEKRTISVMLAKSFADTTRIGFRYAVVNDPHYWGEELVHVESGHMLVTQA